MNKDQESVSFRAPISADGAQVHNLVANCPPLDTNSIYCNLLQCTHFASTSVAAEINQELAGFVSGYLKPEQPDTLFIWQVAVGEPARGRGLATRMLSHILNRTDCQNVRWLETTITESNAPSWALFQSFAASLDADIQSSVLFDKQTHFNDKHESERLVRIGPIGL
ncbi:MAG: diaminobutyrate acetyltransferase [Gammaproteobacteria bacterium]|jgi:L-2,4-diaminobutyric acid acetyltransferase